MKRWSIFAMALVVIVFCLSACGQTSGNNTKTESEKGVVQVLYFHGHQRCATCVAVEERTKEQLETEYFDAQKEGKLKFRAIDFSKSDGEAIADRYEVAYSSLLLVKDGNVVNLTDMGFRYARTEPETFKANLKAEIDKLLE